MNQEKSTARTEAPASVPVITDKHFADWESHVFGYGYGTGEEHTLPVLRTFLATTLSDGTYDYRELERVLSAPVAWLLLNALCHADILEYGTSPRFGWLTKKGKLLREYVGARTPDQLYDIIGANDRAETCYPDHCNCAAPCNNPLFRREL